MNVINSISTFLPLFLIAACFFSCCKEEKRTTGKNGTVVAANDSNIAEVGTIAVEGGFVYLRLPRGTAPQDMVGRQNFSGMIVVENEGCVFWFIDQKAARKSIMQSIESSKRNSANDCNHELVEYIISTSDMGIIHESSGPEQSFGMKTLAALVYEPKSKLSVRLPDTRNGKLNGEVYWRTIPVVPVREDSWTDGLRDDY